MADELGIDTTNYGRLERGECKIPVERLIKIAEVLNVELSSFLSSEISENNLSEGNTNAILLGILVEIRALRHTLSNLEWNRMNAGSDVENSKFTNLQ
ncbi:MAG: Helix-turn-helix domain [Bacteroidota bacterium]|jgi:transcriptional regulator with XRE-family HTH domain